MPNPGALTARLPIVLPSPKSEVLSLSAVPELLRDELLHELFERQCDICSGAVALVCGDVRMTYAELDRRANQLAHFLRDQGVANGHCVAMLLPRGIETYIAVLGILKAGAAYVPLDASFPAERIQMVLRDCGAKILVTDSSLLAKCAGFAGITIPLDRQQANI